MTELFATLLQSDEHVDQLARAIETASPASIVAHDTETGASPALAEVFDKPELLPWVGAYCTGISVCVTWAEHTELDGFYIPVGHKTGNASRMAVRRLLEALSRTRGTHLLHHANFDWDVLEHLDPAYVPSKRAVDTQVARWLADENQPKGLKTLGELYLDEDAGKEQRELHRALGPNLPDGWKQTETYRHIRAEFPEIPVKEARAMARELRRSRRWGELTVQEMYPYAARDATMTAQIAEFFPGYGEVLKPSAPLQRELDLQHVLHAMTKRGVGVHIDKLEAAGREYHMRAAVLAGRYQEAYGAKVREQFGKKTEVNLNSSQQVAYILFELEGLPVKLRTPGGEPSTDKNALEMLEGNEVAAGVLAYRKWTKARTAYAEAFARFAEYSPDGRIHGHYSSVRTVTGRLAASGPNVMTIPRKDSLPEIRAAFSKVAPGYRRIGYDLASAELWVTASLTKDPMLTQTLLDGRNLHLETMVAVFGGEPDKERREYTLSKNVNYGIEYGAGLDQIAKFAAKAGYGPEEAEHVARRIRNGHKRVFARQHYISDFLAQKAQELGALPLHVPGRYRHFKSPGVAVGYYTALNALVQGGVAEFMKTTMLALVDLHPDIAEWLILQVHDELVFDAPDEPWVEQYIHDALTSISLAINPFRYPLTWEGKQWAA